MLSSRDPAILSFHLTPIESHETPVIHTFAPQTPAAPVPKYLTLPYHTTTTTMPADYASTARALALNVSSSPETSPTTSPVWRRPRASSSFSRRPFDCPQTFRDRLRHHYSRLRSHSEDLYNRLSALQLAGLCVLGVAGIVFAVLFLVYNERFFHWLKPVAEKWRGLRGGWCLLWLMTFVVSFPPLIGYSTCVTLAGFIYGLPNGFVSLPRNVHSYTQTHLYTPPHK